MSSVPRITGEYKIISSNVFASVNRGSDGYGELISYNAPSVSLLYSMVLEFNSENVEIKIEIDEKVAFEFSLKDLDYITNQFQNSHYIIHLDKNNDAFILKPTYPVMIRNSLKVFAKATSNSNSRALEQYHIELSEE